MKHAVLFLSLLSACSSQSCSIIPVGFFGSHGANTQFNLDFSSPSLPAGAIATRTGQNVYAQTGTNAVQLITTADVPENRGTPTGWGHWTWRTSTAEIAAPNNFASVWAIATGNGVRTATGTVGPDGSTNGTYVYDVSPDEPAKLTYAGSTATTNLVIQASVWVKDTGVAAPSFSNGIMVDPTTLDAAAVGTAVEQGTKFTANSNGNVVALTFYKGASDGLTSHTLTLWNNSGTSLASVSTSNETSTGWQVQVLGSPVALTSGTVYRVSQTYASPSAIYVQEHATTTWPSTIGNVTINAVAYSLTPGAYPGNDSTGVNEPATSILFESSSVTAQAPTSPGEIIPLAAGSAYTTIGTPSSSVWTRLSSSYAVSGTATGGFVLYAAGANNVGASFVATPGSVGGYQFALAQLAENVYQGDPPALATSGSSGDLTLKVTNSTYLNQIPDGSGVFHVIADFAVDGADTSWPPANPAVALFDCDTADGKYTVYAGNQSVISADVRGVASGTNGLTANIGGLLTDSITRIELYYNPSNTTSKLQALVNGLLNLANGSAISGVVTGAVHSPTQCNIGSKTDGSLISMRRNTRFARADYVGRSDPDIVEGLMIGDSLTSDYGAHNNIGKRIYTISEAQSRVGIGNYAFPGETINQQKTRYDNGPQKGKSYVKWFFLDIGTNDVALNHTETTISSDYQALVNDIAAANSGAEIYCSPILPAGDWTGGQLTVWQGVNADISGTGAHPITGCTVVMDSLVPFNNGSDGLATRCDTGDHRHETDACGTEWSAIKRAQLQARSMLTGGSAPTCASFNPSHAAVGATVTITGTGLTPISRASFNGTKVTQLAPSTSPTSDTSFTTVVPTGATTGTITIGSPLGSANCSGTFTIP